MRKPKTRKERLEFLRKKRGDLVTYMVAPMTDREFKKFFDGMYLAYKDKEDYVSPEYKTPNCLVCGSETITTWECACGYAIIDELDPCLKELIDNGKYDSIRKVYMK